MAQPCPTSTIPCSSQAHVITAKRRVQHCQHLDPAHTHLRARRFSRSWTASSATSYLYAAGGSITSTSFRSHPRRKLIREPVWFSGCIIPRFTVIHLSVAARPSHKVQARCPDPGLDYSGHWESYCCWIGSKFGAHVYLTVILRFPSSHVLCPHHSQLLPTALAPPIYPLPRLVSTHLPVLLLVFLLPFAASCFHRHPY